MKRVMIMLGLMAAMLFLANCGGTEDESQEMEANLEVQLKTEIGDISSIEPIPMCLYGWSYVGSNPITMSASMLSSVDRHSLKVDEAGNDYLMGIDSQTKTKVWVQRRLYNYSVDVNPWNNLSDSPTYYPPLGSAATIVPNGLVALEVNGSLPFLLTESAAGVFTLRKYNSLSMSHRWPGVATIIPEDIPGYTPTSSAVSMISVNSVLLIAIARKHEMASQVKTVIDIYGYDVSSNSHNLLLTYEVNDRVINRPDELSLALTSSKIFISYNYKNVPVANNPVKAAVVFYPDDPSSLTPDFAELPYQATIAFSSVTEVDSTTMAVSKDQWQKLFIASRLKIQPNPADPKGIYYRYYVHKLDGDNVFQPVGRESNVTTPTAEADGLVTDLAGISQVMKLAAGTDRLYLGFVNRDEVIDKQNVYVLTHTFNDDTIDWDYLKRCGATNTEAAEQEWMSPEYFSLDARGSNAKNPYIFYMPAATGTMSGRVMRYWHATIP